jgi:hypothetical protein
MRARAALVAAIVANVGCSIYWVEGPPRPLDPSRPLECTLQPSFPRIDALLSFAWFLASISRFEYGDQDAAPDPAFVSLAAIHLTSAVIGSVRIDRCRAAHRERNAWLESR